MMAKPAELVKPGMTACIPDGIFAMIVGCRDEIVQDPSFTVLGTLF
jgi:hypothetical protein